MTAHAGLTAPAQALAVLAALPDAKLHTPWSAAPCPAHDDDSPSFGWKVADDGAVILKCQAGCASEAIVAALGIEMRDLFPPTERKPRPRVVRTTEHVIRDAAGEPQAIHVRLDYSDGTKQCPWRLPGADPKDNGLKGRRVETLPLYGSDQVAEWPADAGVVVVEGEKAADALRAAGVRALATVTGAEHTPDPGPLDVLRGRVVTLWPDNDAIGREHMRKLAHALDGIASGVTWVEPPEDAPRGWDAADLLTLADDPKAALAGIRDRIGPVPTPEPPPLAHDAPRTLAATLDAAHAYSTGYVVFPSPHEPVAVALWTAHAHAADAAETSPYLAATSAEKRSGKTRLLDVLEQLTPRPWRAVTPSEAVVFRKLAQDHPTLLLDEVDAIFGTKRQADSHEGLRAILNAGNRRGTTVPRIVGEGKRMRVEDFDVFGPKALAGIGRMPDTVADRSIPVRLERRARTEPVAKFRYREAEPARRAHPVALAAHLGPLIDRLAHARPASAPARGPGRGRLGAAAGHRGRGRRRLARACSRGCCGPVGGPRGRPGRRARAHPAARRIAATPSTGAAPPA